jgi:hypothetical protein
VWPLPPLAPRSLASGPVVSVRSAFGRAVVPVAGGIVVLAAIFAATFGLASWISRGGAETSTRLAPETLPVGAVERVAASIADRGPMLFPGLDTTTGERTLILDHEGDDPTRGWRVYLAYPATADPSCGVTQVRGTSRFTDCNDDELDITELARPTDACPIVENREHLSIGLRAERCD